MIRRGSAGVLRSMAGDARFAGAGELSVHMALSARDGAMGTGEGKGGR